MKHSKNNCILTPPGRIIYWVFSLVFFSGICRAQTFNNLEKALKNPVSVTELDLKREKLTEVPPEIFEFENLEILDLSRNRLTTLRGDFGRLSKLHTLILSKNSLTSFPLMLAELPSLQTLLLDRNPIDSIPPEIVNFEKLELLDLWDSEVQYIDKALLQMDSLKYIDLRNTYFKSEELKWITEGRPDINLKSTYGCDCD